MSAGVFAIWFVLPSRALRFHQQVGVHFALTPALNPGMRMQRDVRPICCGGFFRFFPPGAVAQDCGSGMLPGPACAFGQQRLLGLELVGRLVCSVCLRAATFVGLGVGGQTWSAACAFVQQVSE